ncbi:hypothetical protein HDV00_004926 [Rhizophlyctis rosea]|nr:hypothetical protein HDV00_004926 [Rhizophlyctis rosea]
MLSNLISKLAFVPTSFADEVDDVDSPMSDAPQWDRLGNAAVKGDSDSFKKLEIFEDKFNTFSSATHTNSSVRDLYHQLLNPELYPSVLPAAQTFFEKHAAEALRSAREDANACDPSTSASQALSLGAALRDGYSPQALDEFMLATHTRTMEAFWSYRKEWDERVANLAEGEPVESINQMFPGREFAKWWLTVCAPTKLVDGSWLQNHASTETPPALRRFAQPLFKTFAEELGEGLPEQNHVNVYEATLASEGIHLPPHSTYAFAHHPSLPTVSFTRGVIQLILGQFSSSHLFPESLGYNLGYEQLPLHLMVTCNEFKLLKMDYNYFQLHVTIDNAATGHAAMATEAVKEYLDWVRCEEGEEAMQRHWERILTGYYLSETNEMQGLIEETRAQYRRLLLRRGTDGELGPLIRSTADPSQSPQQTRFLLAQAVQHILTTKAPYAAKIHGPELMLGNRSVAEWLDPRGIEDRSEDLIKAMAGSKWIKKGKPEESPFLTKLCGFGGGMFGVFTKDERRVLEAWVAGMKEGRSPGDEKGCPFSGATSASASAATASENGSPFATTKAASVTEARTAPVSTSSSESAQAMHNLIESKRAMGRTRHSDLTLPHQAMGTRTINSWFDDIPNFMVALKEGGMCDRDVDGISKLEKSVMKGGCMASWFREKDREVVKKWVEDGAPLVEGTDKSEAVAIFTPVGRAVAPAAESDIAARRASVSSSFSAESPSPLADRDEDFTDAVEIAERMLGIGVGQDEKMKNASKAGVGQGPDFKVDDETMQGIVEGMSDEAVFWVLANGENRPFARLLASYIVRTTHSKQSSTSTVPPLTSQTSTLDSLTPLLQVFSAGAPYSKLFYPHFHGTPLGTMLFRVRMILEGYEEVGSGVRDFVESVLKAKGVYTPPITHPNFASYLPSSSSSNLKLPIYTLALTLSPLTNLPAVVAYTKFLSDLLNDVLPNVVRGVGTCVDDCRRLGAKVGDEWEKIQKWVAGWEGERRRDVLRREGGIRRMFAELF